jgi:uncharacterized integral membrane protein
MDSEPTSPKPAPSEKEAAPPAQPPHELAPYRGTGISWALVFGIVITVLVAVLAAANTTPVEVNLIFWKVQAPLITLILIVIVLAVIVDELVGIAVRRRRRQRLHEQHQLRQLKQDSK